MSRDPIFRPWMDQLLKLLGAGAAVTGLYVVLMVYFGLSPKTLSAGYMPQQPVPYSHALHVGELGLDCRYCHTTVESAAFAAVPPTQTCINCHEKIAPTSHKLDPVRDSFVSGLPVQWIKVHDLPDYVYFNHSAHVTRGVSCVECHGRIDTMERVYQHERLSMGWCLECHRTPDPHIRNPDLVTQLDWGLDIALRDLLETSAEWRAFNSLNPSQDCSTCHR